MTTRVLAQEEGGDNIFLIPNATLFAELLIFLAIFYVIWRYAMPPVKRAMRDRQEMVRKQIEDARRARELLEQADAKYRELLGEAKTEAAKIRDEARAEAGRIKAELREQADREVALIRQRAGEQLELQRARVVAELRGEIGRLSLTLAERIVGESLEDEAARRGTVDRFIAELEGMSAEEEAGRDAGKAKAPAKSGRSGGGGRRKS
jgi:F-type H+-transporting ATPase subunit b